MKKLTAILCAVFLVAALAGCGSKTDGNYSNSTLTGKVVGIDGYVVTLSLGEISGGSGDVSRGSQGGAWGGYGDTNGGASGETARNATGESPIDASGGASEGQGGSPSGGEGGSGQQGESQNGSDTGTPGASGENGSGSGNQNGSGGQGGSASWSFSSNGKTAVIDLSGAAFSRESASGASDVKMSDLAKGDVVVVTVGNNNAVSKVVVKYGFAKTA